MPKPSVFTGSCTALITPFRAGNVDYEALARLIEFQIAGGTDAILVCGTTGESATLTEEEKKRVTAFSVERISGRVPVLVGTGSNDTARAVAMTRFAASSGADAALLVTPYYNKANPAGLIKHFETIADCADIPNVLYNVPSRTGMQIPLSVYQRLCAHPNIVAVKEASGDLSMILQVMETCGDALAVYSGNDDQTVALMAMGAAGVISVAANLLPGEMHETCRLCLSGCVSEAAKRLFRYLPLIRALFLQVNPVPVKTALSRMGLCRPELRLPLAEPEKEEAETLFETMKETGIL